MHFKLREVSIYFFFLLCPKAVSKMFQAIKFANFFVGTTDSFGNLRFFTKFQMYSLLVSMSVKTLSRQKNTVRLSGKPFSKCHIFTVTVKFIDKRSCRDVKIRNNFLKNCTTLQTWSYSSQEWFSVVIGNTFSD